MPRIAARQPDGTIMVAYGHAAVIVNENDGPFSIVDPYSIGTGWSKIRFGEWEEVNEPLPEGFFSQEVLDLMAHFERRWLRGKDDSIRQEWLEARPDTGDPPPRI